MAGRIQHIVNQTIKHHKQSVNSARLYGRWMHRNPGKVLLPFNLEPTGKVNLKKEKIIDLNSVKINKSTEKITKAQEIAKDEGTSENHQSISNPVKSRNLKSKREEKLKTKFFLSQKKVFEENGEIIYEKLKENDGRIGSLMVNLKSKKERNKSGHTLVEGWRLIVDGLEAKCKLKYVIFSRTDELNNLRPFLPNTGVLFYKIPYKEIQLFSDVETPSGIFGIFEIPRAEEMAKNPKLLPLHFLCDNVRMPGNLGAILRAAVGAGCQKVILTKGCVNVWDPKVIRSGAGAHFRLPIYHSVDWLQMNSLIEPNTSIFIADSNAKIDEIEGKNELGNDQLPVLPYYGVEYSSLDHVTLVIGGETEGISEESYFLAASRNGFRLNIPMNKGVDSLNTGMATAIIAFEIRKQMIQACKKTRDDRIRGEAT